MMKRAVVLLCLCWTHLAQADLVSRTTGEVFKQATRFEIVRVDTGGQRPMGTVLEVHAGKAKVGDKVAVPAPLGASFTPGATILVVCGADLCASGAEIGGAFQLSPDGFESELVPGFVPRTAIPDLLAGKDVRLCIHAHVGFLDETARLELGGDFSALDGSSKAITGFDPTDGVTTGTLVLGEGGRGAGPDRTSLALLRGELGKQISSVLSSGPLLPEKACWGADYTVELPLARTQRVFRAMMRGWHGQYIVARAKLTIAAGHGLPTRSSVLVTWGKTGLRWTSPLWKAAQPIQTVGGGHRADLGFPIGPAKDKRYLSIMTDASPSWMAAGQPVRFKIRVHRLGEDGDTVGTIVFQHVDDPTPPPTAR